MIFFRRGPKSDAEGAPKYEYEEAINFAVFPSLQGGPTPSNPPLTPNPNPNPNPNPDPDHWP